MSKQVKLYKAIGLSMVLYPMFSMAADVAPTPATTTTTTKPVTNPSEMPKDVWLEKIKMVVPEPICKGFMEDTSIAARLKEQDISLEKCIALIPAIADKCQKKYYDNLPAMINQESASKWGRSIGECIGGDFAMNYLYPNSSPKTPDQTKPEPTKTKSQ